MLTLSSSSPTREVGIEGPTIEVRFENLEVSAEVYLGERGVPTITNSFVNKTEEALNILHVVQSRKIPIFILHGISGIIKPSRSTRQDLSNGMGGLYAAVMFIGVQNSQMVQPIVDIEHTVFYRERAAGMYAALPYAFGQVAIEVPYVLLQALIYEIIVYSMGGFDWTAPKFFWFFFIFTAFLYFSMA